MATERMQKQPTFILSNLFYMSKITDELSQEIALKIIKTKVTSELSIKLYHGSFADDYTKSLEIIGYKKDGKISVLNFSDFIHEYRKVIVSSEGYINNDIKSYVNYLGTKVKHYSVSELKDLREASKEFNR